MVLLPIPVTYEWLNKLFPLWSQFLPGIAKRSKEPIEELLGQIARHEIQPILIWDEARKVPMALIGVRYVRRGDDLIADLVWTTGKDMKQWRHLLGELERYLTEHIGCDEIRPICRPGWAPFLKGRGYRITHYTLEKRLKD